MDQIVGSHVPFLNHTNIEVYSNTVAVSNLASAAQVLTGVKKDAGLSINFFFFKESHVR